MKKQYKELLRETDAITDAEIMQIVMPALSGSIKVNPTTEMLNVLMKLVMVGVGLYAVRKDLRDDLEKLYAQDMQTSPKPDQIKPTERPQTIEEYIGELNDPS